MKKRNPVYKIVCLLILLFSLSGCWDQNEIEKRAYVIAIGMDKAEEGNIKITYLIENPEFGSQQQGGSVNEPPQEIISFVANDLSSARNIANGVIAKQVTYDMLTTIIVSKEFAKDKDFIRYMYDATKGMEIRRDVKLVVSKEQSSEFIKKNKPKLETRPHKYFELILNRGAETGMIPNSELITFFRILEADADLFLAAYATTEKKEHTQQDQAQGQFTAGQFHFGGQTNNTNFVGSAVFKEGKMIGTLTGDETRIAILLNNTLSASDVYAVYPDPFNDKYKVATRIIKKRKNEIKMNLKHGTPKIDVTIPLFVEVLSNHSMVNYADSEKKRNKLKKTITKNLTKKIKKLVKKTQEDFKAEPFGWSLAARKKFLTISAYESFDWMKTYPDMKININVNLKFNDFGRQGELPDLNKVRD